MENPIIFFDGLCKLCSSGIKFIVSRDKKNYFRYADLNSDVFRKISEKADMTFLPDSILYYHRGEYKTKSEAVLEIIRHIGGFWKIFLLFGILPPVFRNHLYDLVAHNRYTVFGKNKECYLPSPSEKKLFLP